MSWLDMILGYIALKEIVSGVIGGGVATLAMFGLNWLKDRSLAKHKEELGRESARLTNEMAKASSAELKRLESDLGQSTEAFKSALKKREWLFDKELEAANAFLDWRGKWISTPVGPSFNEEAAAEALLPERFQIEQPMRHFITAYAAVLPADIRAAIQSAYRHFTDSLARANLHEGGVESKLAEKAIVQLMSHVEENERKLYAMIRD